MTKERSDILEKMKSAEKLGLQAKDPRLIRWLKWVLRYQPSDLKKKQGPLKKMMTKVHLQKHIQQTYQIIHITKTNLICSFLFCNV